MQSNWCIKIICGFTYVRSLENSKLSESVDKSLIDSMVEADVVVVCLVGGCATGGWPALTRSIASIIRSNSSSLAPNGTCPQTSMHRVKGSSLSSPFPSAYAATKESRNPLLCVPRSISRVFFTLPSLFFRLYRCSVCKFLDDGLTNHHTCFSCMGWFPSWTSLDIFTPAFTTTASFVCSADRRRKPTGFKIFTATVSSMNHCEADAAATVAAFDRLGASGRSTKTVPSPLFVVSIAKSSVAIFSEFRGGVEGSIVIGVNMEFTLRCCSMTVVSPKTVLASKHEKVDRYGMSATGKTCSTIIPFRTGYWSDGRRRLPS